MASAEKKVRLDEANSQSDIGPQANPIPNGSSSSNARFLSDRRHLLNVFPEEVWDLVFKKVDNPKSLECLSNSSLFLRELLYPQRVQFLFPTVLEIIGGNDHVDKNAISWLMESDICPLKLRSVCQSWNKTIDNLIDNHPFHFYLKYETQLFPNNLWYNFLRHFVNNNTFSEGTDLHVQFLSHFDRTHGNTGRNPFLGRSIAIDFERAHEEEEIMANFVPAVRSVLQKYGMHIFYCSVSTKDLVLLSNSQLYSLTREFLQLMPNLKVFKYVGNSDSLNSSEDEIKELGECVNENPLPTIPSLQMLATDDLPAPVFQELIRSNNNIVTVDILGMNMNQSYTMSTVALPLLTTFSLNYSLEIDIRFLNRLRLTWPLTRLCLKDWTSKKPISCKTVLDAVNNFSTTLTHLQLDLPQVKGVQDKVYDDHLTLNLPNLSNLSLEMYNVICLDFLLSAKDSLRVFELSVDLDETTRMRALELMQEAETGHAKNIKFLSCQSGLESNVWTLFPYLTQIKFTLKAKIALDYSEYREILGWSCSRQEWIKRASLSTI